MSHHITDEQIDRICYMATEIRFAKTDEAAQAVIDKIRAVLALAAPAPAPAPAVPSDERAALQRIADWSEHPPMLGVDYGSDGVRDYYRKIARAALTAAPSPPAPRPDWLHLKRYGYAPGNYMCRCHRCGQVADGLDKRANCCRPCAEEAHAAKPAVPEDVARNAERYRWLRDMASQDWLHRNHNYQNLRGAAFDAAIDAARKAEMGES